MYGSEKCDPVVKYYDEIFAVTSSNDIFWFVEQARVSGGRVLDLACGTGRVAIAVAEAGHEVTAIDSSPGMLARFRGKLTDRSKAVQSRIGIHQSDMHSFTVPGRFSAVLCCDAFFHILTVDDQIGCLRRIVSHLVPGGRFIFNIPNPTVAFRYEAIHLLHRCGFEVESLTGNYRGAPVSEGSQLVFVARLAE